MSKTDARVITDVKKVAARLKELKAESKDTKAWWTPALTFNWRAIHAGGNCQWVPVAYSDSQGLRATKLNVRIKQERQSKRIMPVSSEDLAKMQAQIKNPKIKLELRGTKKPALQVLKWSCKVATAADNEFLALETPRDEFLSDYYQAAELIDEAFSHEASERVSKGEDLVFLLKSKEDPKSVFAKLGLAVPGDAILSTAQVKTLAREAGVAAAEAAKKVAIQVPNTKVCRLVQTTITSQESSNVGKLLVNPITRVNINYEQTTGKLQCDLFDGAKGYKDPSGRLRFEPAKVDGVDVTNANIHAFLQPGSRVDGIVCMDSVCCSNMGISMPVRLDIGVVTRPEKKELNQDDVYDDVEVPPAVAASGSSSGSTSGSSSGSTSSASGSTSSSASSSASSSGSALAPAALADLVDSLNIEA